MNEYRRAQVYPHAETFCVLREPTQRLASVAGYHMGPDSTNAIRLNAWVLDKLHKYKTDAFDGLGGHLWPQTYWTPDCDVILRYESLAQDLNALTARVGCAVKAPANFVKPPGPWPGVLDTPSTHAFRAGWGSSRGNLVPALSYEVLRAAKGVYRDDYALYEKLRNKDDVVGTIYSRI